MLGTFDLRLFGRWVVSGDDTEQLLWDLFDQIVMGSNAKVTIGGMTVAIKANERNVQDAQERQEFRYTPEWHELHSNYFLSKMSEGNLFFGVRMPSELFFSLHCSSLLGIVMENTYSSYKSMRDTNIAAWKFGSNTPEFEKAMANKPSNRYLYGNDFSPSTIINFLMAKKILTLQPTNDRAINGVYTEAELQDILSSLDAEDERLNAEEKYLARKVSGASPQAATKKPPRKTASRQR